MRKFSKWILSALCAVFAFAGVATLQKSEEVTASAAVATEYEVVDTTVMMRLEDVYVANGNFNLYFVIPEMEVEKTGSISFNSINLWNEFNKLGFFDNVKIGNKTLKELGCVGFWSDKTIKENSMGINAVEKGAFPYNHIQLYCHADPETWSAAYNAGEIGFNTSDLTIAEGTLIPSYGYLMGEEGAKLYRASCEYVTRAADHNKVNYGKISYGQTDIESLEYVQGHDGTSGYVGVSLKGDDYLGDGSQIAINQNYKGHYNNFTKNIVMNGKTNADEKVVEYYGLFNLGEKGKGYYAFASYISENDLASITIPAGTLFPSRALNVLFSTNNTYPIIVYETQTTQTFYKTADGKYVSFDTYLASAKADVQATYEAKVADCFAEDKATLDSTVATAKAALESASTIEDIDVAYGAAKAVYASILTKSEAVFAATEELNAYKAEDGYFRDAEKAQRDAFVATAIANLPTATTKSALADIVSTAKASIDGLKTAAQYADEELATVKAAAREEIYGYRALEAYLWEQAALKADAIEAGILAVAEARNEAEIEAAVATVKAALDALETKASIVAAAKAEVNAYKAEEVYRDAQASMREGMISDALFEIDAATTQEDVNAAVARAKERIDTLKTDAELTAEEKEAADQALAAEKQMALDQINAVKATVIFKDYTKENQANINTLYKAAKDKVANALTSEELSAAVSEFIAELEKLPKVEQTPADTDDSSAQKSGCSAIAGVSSIMALTVAFGAVAFAKKRKEN